MMTAYEEGFDARLCGKSIEDVPYVAGTSQWLDWRVGWQDQDQHLNDRDDALASIGWFGT